jgi:hypothetical protein
MAHQQNTTINRTKVLGSLHDELKTLKTTKRCKREIYISVCKCSAAYGTGIRTTVKRRRCEISGHDTI